MNPPLPEDAPFDPTADPLYEHRRRWLWILIVLAVLAVAGALSARPAWRLVKRYRADRFAQQAVAMERDKQWAVAVERARSALQLAPDQPEALRVSAHAFALAQHEGAFHFYDNLLATPAATVEDRQDCVEFALRLGRTNVAGAQLEVLRKIDPPSARTLLLASGYETLRGNIPAAIPLAREAVRLDPGNATNILNLATILARSGESAERDEARATLWPLARTDGPLRRVALRTLVTDLATPRAEREKALAVLRALPQPTVEDRLMYFEAALSLEPTRGQEIARDVARLSPADDRDLSLIVNWLIVHGFAGDASPLLVGARALRNPDLFLARFRALGASGEKQKAYDWLFSPGVPLDPFDLEDLRCRAAHDLGDTNRRNAHLTAAFKLAGTDPGRLDQASRLAMACDRLPLAVAAWSPLVSQPTLARSALLHLALFATLQNHTAAARDHYQQLVRLEPGNDDFRLSLAHLDLLLDENVDRATAEAVRQFEKTPDLARVRAVAALGHLRRGDLDKAGLAVVGTVIRDEDESDSLAAILAAVLEARGDWEKAQEMLQRIRLSALRPEERELLRPLLLRSMPAG